MRIVSSAIAVGLLCLATGCGAPPTAPAPKADGHNHPDHAAPTTLGGAVHELEELKGAIQTAFEAGKPESAHDALHEVGAVLTAAEKLVETGAEADHRAEAATAVEGLFEAFGKLDDSLHSNQAIAYSDVAEQIDSAIETLEAACPAGNHADHDHADHAEHDHDAAGEEGHDHGAGEADHAEPPAG